MRLGLYGGSFDPIHFGHLVPLRQAKQVLGLDRVVYLPTARPPHKVGQRMAPSWARYTMVELALLHEDGLVASDFEMPSEHGARRDTSYTIDTLEHWKRQQPGVELVLFMGGDAFLGLETWHRWQDILRTAQVAVLPRPGAMGDAFEAGASQNLQAALASGQATIVSEIPSLDISSSAIRQHLTSDPSRCEDWVPRLVLDYIRKYDLYS